MAVEGAPVITPSDVALAARIYKGAKQLFGMGSGGTDYNREILKEAAANPKKREAGREPGTAQTNPRPRPAPSTAKPVVSPPPAGSTPAPPKAPAPSVSPTAPKPGIPASTAKIFEGTTSGKVIGNAARLPQDVAKGVAKGARGGVVGTAILLGVEAGQAIINARENQKALEDRQYSEKTKREERADNQRVQEIRRRADEEAKRVLREEREKDRQAAMARTQARIAAKKAESEARRQERQLAREANNRAQAKIEENRQLEAEQKRLDAQQAKAAKAARAGKIQQIRNLASVAGLLYSLGKSGKKGKNRAAPPVLTPLLPTAPGVRRTIPARPDFRELAAPPPVSFESPPAQLFESLAPSKTIVASKTKVKKCVSDAPKRKKGRCRTGFFRETPNRTTYKTWSERKCL